MRVKKAISLMAIFLSFSFAGILFAETIVLKSGKKVEGNILEKTDTYIKIDFQGLPLTYFFDEIQSIDESRVGISKDTNAFAQSSVTTALKEEELSLEDLLGVTNYYYTKPQPDKLVAVLKVLIRREDFINDAKVSGPFGHFIATVAHHDFMFLNLLKSVRDQNVGLSKIFLQNVVNEAEAFQSPAPDTQNNLNYLWGEFIATGDKGPVMKIISVLGYPANETNASLIEWAESSLILNAYYHTKVYEFVKEVFTLSSDQMKEKLDKVIKTSQEGYKHNLSKYGFVDEGYFKEKKERLDKLVESNPEDAKNYLSRGIASANNLNFNQALSDFEKALELNPNLPIANNYVCYIYISKNQHDKGEAYCNKAIEQAPNFSKPYFNLARIYQYKNDLAKAVDFITKAISFEPNFFEAYILRAKIFDEMGEYEKELTDLQKAKKMNFKQKDYIEFEINKVQEKINNQ